MSQFDYGHLSGPHLTMILNEIMVRHGLATLVYPAEEYLGNVYSEIDRPEFSYNDESDPVGNTEPVATKVFLSKPVEGLLLSSNFVSYHDKIETQYQITSKIAMKTNDRLDITMTDGATMSLRVIEPSTTYHQSSKFFFKTMGVVI